MTERELIDGCRKQERKAQQMLFERFAPTMLGVCRRYVKSPEDAEDVMIEGFFKVMTNIGQYQGLGSFEGWIRRIMVNESLMFLRRRHDFRFTLEVLPNLHLETDGSVVDDLSASEILLLIESLPVGYRTVFNLYVIEGYKHHEIASLLGISTNTSKSQLMMARERLQKMILQRLDSENHKTG